MLQTILNAGKGHSGIRLETLELIRSMLNLDLIPYAPSEGSVGYLGVEAHLAMAYIGEGKESDAVFSYAVAISSIETIIIIALGVLLLKPLEPVFALPAVKTATQYVIPALFGSLLLGLFAKGSGDHYVKNKNLIVLAPAAATVLALLFIPGMSGYQGFAVLGAIPIAIGWAYLLYKKGIVKMVSASKNET